MALLGCCWRAGRNGDVCCPHAQTTKGCTAMVTMTLPRTLRVLLAAGALMLTVGPVLAADLSFDEVDYLAATMPLVARDTAALNDLTAITGAIGDQSVPYSLGVSMIPAVCSRFHQVKLDFDPVQAPVRFARLDSLLASGFKSMIAACDGIAHGGRTYDLTEMNQAVVSMNNGDDYFRQANQELLQLGISPTTQ